MVLMPLVKIWTGAVMPLVNALVAVFGMVIALLLVTLFVVVVAMLITMLRMVVLTVLIFEI